MQLVVIFFFFYKRDYERAGTEYSLPFDAANTITRV